jgi:putative two-component system response regulator
MNNRSTILIVDDVKENLDILVELLGEEYDVRVCMDGPSTLKEVPRLLPDLILLDVMMPGMDGYEVCRRLKEDESLATIPVIFLTAMNQEEDENKGLGVGAVDYITKPFAPNLVKLRIQNQLELKKHKDRLEDLVKERTKELQVAHEATIQSMGILAEYRDPETGGHIMRTRTYVKHLAEYLYACYPDRFDLNPKKIQLLFTSAPLHDVGKIGIPDNILLKPGKLTEDEFEHMKMHSRFGADAIAKTENILGGSSFLYYAREIAHFHHEKWDGSGYPDKLSGEDIPLSARIMAIADVYDALISRRPYKEPFSHEKAVGIILDGKGKHFDPVLVDSFQVIHSEFDMIAKNFQD